MVVNQRAMGSLRKPICHACARLHHNPVLAFKHHSDIHSDGVTDLDSESRDPFATNAAFADATVALVGE
jgi:hypothetical protein